MTPAFGKTPPGSEGSTPESVAALHLGICHLPLRRPSRYALVGSTALGTRVNKPATVSVPWFGARKLARDLLAELSDLKTQHAQAKAQLQELGALTVLQLEEKRSSLSKAIEEQQAKLLEDKSRLLAETETLKVALDQVRLAVVTTEELALLQEAGVYRYQHPLAAAVAYQKALDTIDEQIKAMVKVDGGAVLAAKSWTVNGSEAKGKTMLRDYAKLMLRAFNAEADSLVRDLKPHKLEAAKERLTKVSETIARLGKTMDIRIAPAYLRLRINELELTADFVQKQAEEKEAERQERERLKEERKVQQEIERERARLDKERRHYMNALEALLAKGDEAGAERMRAQLADVDRALADVDYRTANIRAGYVYVISNVGSFGERLVKVGMTRRLDPLDRIRELSDASVPFNFDVHALFFSKDAVGIETAMHAKLADRRLNMVNRRREFFQATPTEVKQHLSELAGELLEFREVPEALEYRQCMKQRSEASSQSQ